ncbi:hypothetical protein N510_001220 [Firmicutes bacterium ASF500]|nr:hypothetical protein N510_001220 [Firmicutes bacterium ASF500]
MCAPSSNQGLIWLMQDVLFWNIFWKEGYEYAYILLAEDECDLNQIIRQKLTSDGYVVDCCFDGEEAMDYMACADYDAIIPDIMMPQKDGLEVLCAPCGSPGKGLQSCS